MGTESLNDLKEKVRRGELAVEGNGDLEEDYEIGYFTDDYDIVAKAPITKSFKVKVKIRSISRLHRYRRTKRMV